MIELLVVIAIIAILASLLLPALTRARISARRIVCASQLRQCSLTLSAYESDFDGVMPLSTSADISRHIASLCMFNGLAASVPTPM